jgi:molecular chaperone GrpE
MSSWSTGVRVAAAPVATRTPHSAASLRLAPTFSSTAQVRALSFARSARFSSAEKKDEAAESAADAAGADGEGAVDEAALRIAALEKEVQELKQGVQYAIAERENVRRILKKDVEDAREFGMRGFAEDLLDVSDNFQRALDHVKEEELAANESFRKFVDGIKMTEGQLLKVFGKYHIQRHNPLGEKFDPNLHSALVEVDAPEHAPGHVAVVMKHGYTMKDKVLRPADVGVSKKSA